ncbi:MAG TPA: PrsW family glutamic-type intramembrane protease [Candidatus Binatia bacterium]|nr:PrsW family glutamic-type intramembrane protease [Candidatus Binatia bacterium]
MTPASFRVYGFLALLCAPPLVWTIDLLTATPAIVLAAATAPALVLATAVLLVRRRSINRAYVLALLWGATGAAFLSMHGNQLIGRTLASAEFEGRSILAVFLAPVIEEAAKALGLLLLFAVPLRRMPHVASEETLLEGIACGALVGIGFVWTENFLYLGISMLQGGEAGLVAASYLRGFLGASAHAVFTACSGAGIAWWAARGGAAAAVAGIVVAMVQHIAWNGVAAPLVVSTLCSSAAGTMCTGHESSVLQFGGATAIAAAFLVPGFAVLWFSTTKSRSQGVTDSGDRSPSDVDRG